jgi:hypothetical protein
MANYSIRNDVMLHWAHPPPPRGILTHRGSGLMQRLLALYQIRVVGKPMGHTIGMLLDGHLVPRKILCFCSFNHSSPRNLRPILLVAKIPHPEAI